MTRPDSLFEAASYDLNKFRERRMADRRFQARDTPDRRKSPQHTMTPQPGKEEEAGEMQFNPSPEEGESL